ncbi:MAG: hypothetical protein ACFFDW_07855, partial [Candidatus Thorarchaeota archaeon]
IIKEKSSGIIRLKSNNNEINENIQRNFIIEVDMPDAIKKDQLLKPRISIKNNSTTIQLACFEIRQKINDIIKVLEIEGIKLKSQKEIELAPKLALTSPGIYELEFVILNRIGRTLVKESKNISIY